MGYSSRGFFLNFIYRGIYLLPILICFFFYLLKICSYYILELFQDASGDASTLYEVGNSDPRTQRAYCTVLHKIICFKMLAAKPSTQWLPNINIATQSVQSKISRSHLFQLGIQRSLSKISYLGSPLHGGHLTIGSDLLPLQPHYFFHHSIENT